MGELRSLVIGIMLFSLIVTAMVVFSSTLATRQGVILHENLSNDSNLQQLASMNQQLAVASNQTAQVNYNQQGLVGSLGFLAVIPSGFFSIVQEIWILSTNGLSFIVSGITTYLPIPGWLAAGILAIITAFIFIALLAIILGRNI